MAEPTGEKPPQRLVKIGGRRRIVKGAEPDPAESAAPSPAPRTVRAPPPELHTPFDELPPDESNPALRDKPTIGVVEFTAEGRQALGLPLDVPGVETVVEDRSDGTWRTFDDLMGAFPIGGADGEYYMNVERRQPAAYSGYATRGVLRKVTERLTLEQFIEQYGGGQYDLIVYGPPKHAGVIDDETGRPRPKALCKPVRIWIPWHNSGGFPPNPEAAFPLEEEEKNETMTGQNGFAVPGRYRRGGLTNADAQMVSHELKHAETMDDRQRQDRRERQREARDREVSAAELVDRSGARAVDLLREQNRELRQQLSERNKGGGDLEGVASVLREVIPKTSSTDLAEMRESHRREMETLTRTHKDEIDAINRRSSDDRLRAEQTHQGALDRADSRVTEATRRADERVRELEARMDRELQRAKDDIERSKEQLRADHDRELTFVRAEHTRQLEAQRVNYESLLSSERRAAEREVQTKDQIAQSQLTTTQKMMEMDLNSAKAELKRRDREVERLQELVENNKDLGQLLEKAKRQAELLGFVPASEAGGDDDKPAPDVKTMLIGALVEGAKNLPQIIKNAGDAAANLRNPRPAAPEQRGFAQPYPQQFQQQPYQPPMRAFATEASGIQPDSAPSFSYQPAQGTPVPNMAPPPPQPQPVTAYVAEQQAQQPVPVAQQPALAPAPSSNVIPFPPLGQSAQPGPIAPAAPPAAPAPTPEEAAAQAQFNAQIDQLIMSSVPQLEKFFEGGAKPEEIARMLVGSQGPEVVKAHLPTMRAAAIAAAIARSGRQSRLVARAGRKYLMAIEAAVIAELNSTEKAAGAGT
jgi:hypothetical protein